MSPLQPHHKLRVCRKYAGLTQRDLAFLLGLNTGTEISRHERKVRQPALTAVISYELLFDIRPKDILELVYKEQCSNLLEQAKQLKSDLRTRPPTPLILHRIARIDALIIKLKTKIYDT